MRKTVKKVDVKMVQKMVVNGVVVKALTEAGFTVIDGTTLGFTAGTVVARQAGQADVQVKLVTPKAGVTEYPVTSEE